MSNFAIGTLVLFCPPEGNWDVPPGAIGEVVDDRGVEHQIAKDAICVNFTKHPSLSTTGWWAIPTKWLKPLGGNDLLSDEDLEDNPYKVKAPAEDLV